MGTHPFVKLALIGDSLGCTEGDPLGLLAPFESMLSCGPSYLFTESFEDATNDTGFSYTRATTQYVETDTDNIFPVPGGAIPIKGARPVRNLAASSDTPSTQNITVVVGRIYAVRIGDESAASATAVCSGAFTGTLTGDATDIQTFTTGKTATTTTLTVTITGSIRKLQVQDITHRSASSVVPDEYVDSATDYGTGVAGFRYFLTALANTVDGSGKVTELTGAALTGIALAMVPGATNLETLSAGTIATNNITAVADGPSIVAGQDRVRITATSSFAILYLTPTLADSTDYCVWRYLQAGTTDWGFLQTRTKAGASVRTCFDLANGAIGTVNHASAGMREVSTGVYLCWVVFNTATGGTSPLVGCGPAIGDGNFSTSTETIYSHHRQTEAGTLPTSAIVTSGSTASTDAAVLDFSGVTGFITPNETRIVATGLGPNLVTNGTFDSDVSDWSAYRSASLSWASGRLLVTNDGSDFGSARSLGFTTEVGKTYLAIVCGEPGTITSFTAAKSDSNASINSNRVDIVTSQSTAGAFGKQFVATAATTYIWLQNANNGAGTTGYYDGVYVFEVDPTDTTERTIDIDDWDGTDLYDILPHANVISVTQYAPGDRP